MFLDVGDCLAEEPISGHRAQVAREPDFKIGRPRKIRSCGNLYGPLGGVCLLLMPLGSRKPVTGSLPCPVRG